MIGLLLAMYPARWRRRYGEEFRVVLESRPLGPFDVADVFLGALDARLTPLRFHGSAGIDGGPLVMLRLGGFGAILGGVLWFVGLAAGSYFGEGSPWTMCLALGSVGLLLALVGLSAFQAHRDPVLAWAAFAVPGIGALASAIGIVGTSLQPGDDPLLFGSVSAWGVWFIGLLATVIGSIFFAVATIRAAVLSRRAAQALAISCAAVLFVAFLMTGGESPTVLARVIQAVVVGSFAASWVALGILALRRGPIRAVAPA